MEDRKSLEQAAEMKDTCVGPSLTIDRDADRRVLRKIDRHILPLVMLLYLAAFLDRYYNLFDYSYWKRVADVCMYYRVNIGNAKYMVVNVVEWNILLIWLGSMDCKKISDYMEMIIN